MLYLEKAREREERESRLRLVETYQATRDALSAILAAAFGKRAPKTPWYLEAPKGAATGLTGKDLDAAINRLAHRTGRRVETDGSTTRIH